ncbi:hypothetical protein ACNKHU_02730 [Shigella flexneri]
MQLTPILESLAAQYNGQFILGEAGLRRGADDCRPVRSARDSDRVLFQNGQPVDGFQGPQPEEAIRALLDKVLPREEELKARRRCN